METGYYQTITRIKDSATPIDDVTKFAWYDDDYEIVEVWHEYTEEELEERATQEADAQKQKEQEELFKEVPARVDGLEGQLQALISAFGTLD